MNWVIPEKPPWKTVEWIQSPTWTSISATSAPVISYTNKWSHISDETMAKMKETIERLDQAKRWELAKKMANPYELVYTHNDENFPKSICLVSPLSRSFFKMVEILHVCSFFKEQPAKLISAHVAEGPGGFIQALYELSEKNKKKIVGSVAMTLKPVNPQIPGWKKSYKFITKYKQLLIHYGSDGTGDIYSPENQRSYISEVAKIGEAHLFTADGGFDFSDDYALQEMQIFHLLLSSATIGLRVLRVGGHFVLKLFDCMSPHTKLFLVLLSRCFQKWTLYKPAMTRPCNSERYFIGVSLRQNIRTILDMLTQMEIQAAKGNFPDVADLSSSEEIAYLERHIRQSNEVQIRHIENAIYFANNPDVWQKECLNDVLRKSYEWCEFFGVYAKPKSG